MSDLVKWLRFFAQGDDGVSPYNADGPLIYEAADEIERLIPYQWTVDRLHHMLADLDLHPGRTDDDIIDVTRRAIERLRAEIAELKKANDEVNAACCKEAAERDALRSEVSDLRIQASSLIVELDKAARERDALRQTLQFAAELVR